MLLATRNVFLLCVLRQRTCSGTCWALSLEPLDGGSCSLIWAAILEEFFPVVDVVANAGFHPTGDDVRVCSLCCRLSMQLRGVSRGCSRGRHNGKGTFCIVKWRAQEVRGRICGREGQAWYMGHASRWLISPSQITPTVLMLKYRCIRGGRRQPEKQSHHIPRFWRGQACSSHTLLSRSSFLDVVALPVSRLCQTETVEDHVVEERDDILRLGILGGGTGNVWADEIIAHWTPQVFRAV